MSLEIETYILGPIENNTYLITDLSSSKAAVIDPAAPSQALYEKIMETNADLQYILLTHAHFDHVGGVRFLIRQFPRRIQVALHANDVELWNNGGGSKDFGFEFEPGDAPDLLLNDQDVITLGETRIEVLHTPGHTRGHVTYYLPQHHLAFCGDLIFHRGIGRSDLDVSDERDLYSSIREKIFALPDETLLYPGHGPSTSVVEEKENNPFL